MGVSLERVIVVNSIFRKSLWETPGNVPVYAVFSPVLPAGASAFQQQLVLLTSLHHYRLCFRFSFRLLFNSAHSFQFGTRRAARSGWFEGIAEGEVLRPSPVKITGVQSADLVGWAQDDKAVMESWRM